MKREGLKIDYCETIDGLIRIENIRCYTELVIEKFDDDVRRIYIGKSPTCYYSSKKDEFILYFWNGKKFIKKDFGINAIFEKEEFKIITDNIKISLRRLQEIKDQVNKYKIKTIIF